MNLKTFIDRPILSGVVSVMIFVAGLIALANLPVEQYPDIAPPTVKVSAQYSGANADAVEKAVVVPLEEAINGVENMTYMTSTASNTGNAEITVFFKQGTDPDMAAVNVQNKVQTATSLLPAEVTKVGVKTTKSQTSTLKIFGLCSPHGTYDKNFLTNYLSINIKPQIQRISGVGEVSVMGGDYAMRIWLRPDVMAMYGLQPKDVESALSSQNIEASTGAIGEDSENVYQYALKYRGRLEKDSEFENIVIKAFDDGRILRLKDIARVELGAQRYNYTGGVNGAPGVSCMVYQIAGTNANEIITNIDSYLDELKQSLPDDIEIVDLVNTKDFLSASIHEVVKTLIEALLLVVMVVFVFLGNLRSTIIPAISVVVSLVGTFAAIYVAGFSINLLTLFALVLAIGTIVDDAIIVVEAVQARLDQAQAPPQPSPDGEGAELASINNSISHRRELVATAMTNISSAVVTSTLVFMAVFVPVAFMGGTAGVFYKQFGVTMAVAVGISAVNALTLSPALCALFLKPQTASRKASFNLAFDTAFRQMLHKYNSVAKLFVKRKSLSWVLLGIATVALGYFISTSKSSLVPQEDTGALYINLNSPAGSTLSQTEAIMAKIEKELREIPEVENYNVSVGKSIGTANGASYGMFVLKLRHWDERKGRSHSADAVTKEIYRRTAHIKDARLIVFAPPMVSGYGSGGGVELYVQDRAGKGTDSLSHVVQRFITALNGRKEMQRAFTSFDNTFPQYTLDVDEVACQRAGITTSTVLNALASYIGSSYVSNFNRFSKLYRVIIQAPSDYRNSLRSLDNIYVKTTAGMAPVSHFVTLRKTYGAETLTRFNLFSSVKVQGVPAEGYSSGDAIRAIAEVAQATLPRGYGYEYAGMTREESSDSSSSYTLCLSILFIYLILCALYESLWIPFSILLSVPFGLMGSMALARLCGIESNIYLQTGLIMLIGLLSKTAILITEYAVKRRHQGMSLAHAALSAAEVRFRPILMTVLCMAIGMLPLVFASGVGANGNRSLGIGVVGGLVVGTTALLFVTPAFFIAFQWLEERMRQRR